MNTNRYPEVGDQLLISFPNGRQADGVVDQKYGQFRFIAGMRFHVADDELRPGIWMVPRHQAVLRSPHTANSP